MKIHRLLVLSTVLGCLAAQDFPEDGMPPMSPGDIDDLDIMERGGTGCVDLFSSHSCSVYQKRGYCNYASFKQKCAKTCEACKKETASADTMCIDKSRYCKSHYLRGYCRDEKRKKYMMEYCRKTCLMCETSRDASVPASRPYTGGRCGTTAVPLQYLYSHRIIGGSDASYGSIPWQAVIYTSTSNKAFCGAVLIDEQHVLTAAHCFQKSLLPGSYYIYLGKYHRQHMVDDAGDLRVEISKIFIHDDYNKATHDNDIAIIKLKKKVAFTTFIRPVCLPRKTIRLTEGTLALVSGYGVTDVSTKSTSKVLQQVNVNILNTNKCKSWVYKYKRIRNGITDNMFCAGHAKGMKDSCQGDSGGPLVVQYGKQHFLAGIVSWGISCGKAERPGIYVKVQNYLDWIADNVLV